MEEYINVGFGKTKVFKEENVYNLRKRNVMMGLFGKKKDEEMEDVPELPDLPEGYGLSLPVLPSDNIASPPGLEGVEVNTLPPLPGSYEERMRQNEIKNAIVHPGMQGAGFKPWRVSSEIGVPPVATNRGLDVVDIPRRIKVTEPIYVRLDKFQTTVEAFEGIRDKIVEIENLLVKVRDIKAQEEKELMEWENEIQIIKARIEAIDRSVFGKLD